VKGYWKTIKEFSINQNYFEVQEEEWDILIDFRI
jgi:hypothetical protein